MPTVRIHVWKSGTPGWRAGGGRTSKPCTVRPPRGTLMRIECLGLHTGLGVHAGLQDVLGRQKRITLSTKYAREMQPRFHMILAKCGDTHRERILGSHCAIHRRTGSGCRSLMQVWNTCRGAPHAKTGVAAVARSEIMNAHGSRP